MTNVRLQEQINAFGVANVIVKMREQESLAADDDPTITVDESGALSRQVRNVATEHIPHLSALFQHDQMAQRGALAAAAEGRDDAPAMLHFPYLGVLYGAVDQTGLAALEGHDAVASVSDAPQLSLIRPVATASVSAPPPGPTWGLKRLRVPELWDQGITGMGVVIAHIDTGADSQHPALAAAISKTAVFDLKGQLATISGAYSDTGRHGTHTAGTIAGRAGPGDPVIGVAPDATLLDATVIEGGDAVARVLAGMNWALQEGARILSLSLGFRGWEGSFEPIMRVLRAQELLPVVAIGNEGPQTSRSPGNYSSALSVGATDIYNDVAYFSSSQAPGGTASGPLLCAPGSDILSALAGGGYLSMNGSSMATPHVAGLAALLLSAKPLATIDEIQAAIVKSCDNPKNVDPVRIGAGVPDAVKALGYL